MTKNEAYNTLAEIIFKGFIVSDFYFDSNHIIFKTINDKEFELMKIYAGNTNSYDYQFRFNIYFLVFSLLIISNQNVLIDRDKHIDELFTLFSSLPQYILRKMIDLLNTEDARTLEASKYLEGFSYTDRSRSIWKIASETLLTNPEFTGIPGTENIGTNSCQESWILINKSLDNEEKYDTDFSMALLITSASNPKGARQIRNQHSGAVHGLEDRRAHLADIGYMDSKEWSSKGWAARTDTAEELVAELDRQMKGQKDRHDLLIEAHLKQVKDSAEQKRREAEERIKRIRIERGYTPLIEGSQRAMTTEEVSKMIESKKKKLVPSTTGNEMGSARFFKKTNPRILTARGRA